jgi:diguanylate cyclase (GGDEF)-like protein
LLRPSLQSKVGRRLFLSFLLAALLPMGGLAVYAYYTVGDTLTKVSERRLRQDSKGLGMSLIQELNWRAEVLKQHISHGQRVDEILRAPIEGFVSIEPWHGPLSVAETHHLALGRAVFNLSPSGETSLLIRPDDGQPVLRARIDSNTLWRNDEAPEYFCILDGASLRAYHCSDGMRPPADDAWSGSHQGDNSGTFSLKLDSQDFLAAYWHARLQAAYAHPGLVAIVAEPKATMLASLTRFRQVFFAVALLAFGLALLLALSRIRRQMRPLERLTEGTRRLATGDFSGDIETERDDEFGSLGRAFNLMARNLQHKFHMLRMLGELDRAILSASEMDYVLQLVLAHVRASIPCDLACILRLDEHGGGTFLMAGAPGEPLHGKRLDCRDVASFLPTAPETDWYRLDWGMDRPECLRHFGAMPLHMALAFPVRVNARLDSLLLLAYAHAPDDQEDIVAAGRVLTDRLAVAASNIAWEEKLYHQGHYDALTDLPNRVLLRDRVEQALMRAAREQTSVAVMLIDLDRFKEINDSLGHSSGDELLIQCARRLQAATRVSDTAARLGGDEFVLLVPDLARGDEIAALDTMARKLSSLLAEPVELTGRRVTTPASIGIALYPDNATSFEDLLKMADAAMYESKRQQPGGFRFYSAEMNEGVKAHFELTQEIRAAIDNDELLLFYQPKVEARGGRIVAAEALVRWNSPKRGLVPPSLFVPLIDEIGMGNWLGEWVMERACAQMARWAHDGLAPIPVSINISPGQFQESGLIAKVEAALARHGLPPSRLELEILEATAANESPEIRATLLGLRDMGISIALDDFGTGYSSLVYLTQLPANILKLDRAFILTLTEDARQQAIVGRIIALAQALDYRIVAEGVEDEAQLRLLADMGCDLIQGYVVSRPVPAAEFAALLAANHAATT